MYDYEMRTYITQGPMLTVWEVFNVFTGETVMTVADEGTASFEAGVLRQASDAVDMDDTAAINRYRAQLAQDRDRINGALYDTF